MNPTREADLGTPASTAEETVRIEIDGLPTTVKAGSTIMRAARESGVDVPKLCATDNLKPFGSCRLCLVEIEGRKGYPASCTTPVEEGMQIRTQTDALAKLRRNVMELYISDHPLDCLTCSANGDCELQDMAGAVGLRDVRYGFDGENHLDAEVDSSNPYFSFDPSKCIVCSRCVRACDEVQGTFALTIEGRGFESKVSASVSENFIDSECVSCGACVQACPTATLMEKSIIDNGQPDHSVLTTCAYCGVGCSFKADMKGDQVVRMTPYKDGGANQGHSCVKGRFAWGYASHKERVLDPMIRESTDDPWRVVGWDEAISHTAERFKSIPEEIRPQVSWRHYFFTLHERRSVYRAEACARRIRQQQRGHLRARLSFADRLRIETNAGHVGRHATVRECHGSRRDNRYRRQPDRRASCICVADETAAA